MSAQWAQMRNNFVCFGCRRITKASPGATPVCPECNGVMRSVGQMRVPHRNQQKRWRQFRKWYYRRRIIQNDYLIKSIGGRYLEVEKLLNNDWL